MSLMQRGKVWHYEFQVHGKRYRGSCHTTVHARAAQLEKRIMADVQENGFNPFVRRKAPTLETFSVRFLKWVEDDNYLKANTKKYYRYGWEALKGTPLAGMRLEQITKDSARAVSIPGSPSWQNQAFRTLSRMLKKAQEWELIRQAPQIHRVQEERRESCMDLAAEGKLLEVSPQPLRDVILIIRDMGMRPEEVFRMRWEHVDWERKLYFNPRGKRSASRRHLPISQHVLELLAARASNKSEWVFPSKKAKCGHLTTVAKQFRTARALAGLPANMVLYSARHGFGTDVMRETRDAFLTRDALGQKDIKATAIYQHPDLERLREAIDKRNERRVM